MEHTTTVKATELLCRKIRGGKHPLWHANHPDHRITGAGNTAENAIKDFQAQQRWIARAKRS